MLDSQTKCEAQEREREREGDHQQRQSGQYVQGNCQYFKIYSDDECGGPCQYFNIFDADERGASAHLESHPHRSTMNEARRGGVR